MAESGVAPTKAVSPPSPAQAAHAAPARAAPSAGRSATPAQQHVALSDAHIPVENRRAIAANVSRRGNKKFSDQVQKSGSVAATRSPAKPTPVAAAAASVSAPVAAPAPTAATAAKPFSSWEGKPTEFKLQRCLPGRYTAFTIKLTPLENSQGQHGAKVWFYYQETGLNREFVIAEAFDAPIKPELLVEERMSAQIVLGMIDGEPRRLIFGAEPQENGGAVDFWFLAGKQALKFTATAKERKKHGEYGWATNLLDFLINKVATLIALPIAGMVSLYGSATGSQEHKDAAGAMLSDTWSLDLIASSRMALRDWFQPDPSILEWLDTFLSITFEVAVYYLGGWIGRLLGWLLRGLFVGVGGWLARSGWTLIRWLALIAKGKGGVKAVHALLTSLKGMPGGVAEWLGRQGIRAAGSGAGQAIVGAGRKIAQFGSWVGRQIDKGRGVVVRAFESDHVVVREYVEGANLAEATPIRFYAARVVENPMTGQLEKVADVRATPIADAARFLLNPGKAMGLRAEAEAEAAKQAAAVGAAKLAPGLPPWVGKMLPWFRPADTTLASTRLNMILAGSINVQQQFAHHKKGDPPMTINWASVGLDVALALMGNSITNQIRDKFSIKLQGQSMESWIGNFTSAQMAFGFYLRVTSTIRGLASNESKETLRKEGEIVNYYSAARAVALETVLGTPWAIKAFTGPAGERPRDHATVTLAVKVLDTVMKWALVDAVGRQAHKQDPAHEQGVTTPSHAGADTSHVRH